MTEPQESDVVERARQAVDGITPGPWIYSDIIGTDHNVTVDSWDLARCTEAGERTPDEAEANATFIAAAPDLVRDLLAEVERLRDDLRVEGLIRHQCESVDAEVERLRTDLARMTEQAEASILELRDVTRELDAVHGDLAESRAAIDRVRQVTARWAGPNPELSTVPVDEVLRALDGEVSGE